MYMIVAFEAAATVSRDAARSGEYYALAITAADAYLELAGTEASVFSTGRVRDVLAPLGQAYYNRRDLDDTEMRDLTYQYDSIAANQTFGSNCFEPSISGSVLFAP